LRYTDGVSSRRDQADLLGIPPAELQRALLAVPDELLARALCAARPEVRAGLLANLSRKRRAEVDSRSVQLQASGEVAGVPARTALQNLLRRVFGSGASRAAAPRHPTAANQSNAPRRTEDQGPERSGDDRRPDLTESSRELLRESRAVVASLAGLSDHGRHLQRCARGRCGAVLIRKWLGRDPALSRESIYRAICEEPGGKRRSGPARPGP
jgi:hypothetical protein